MKQRKFSLIIDIEQVASEQTLQDIIKYFHQCFKKCYAKLSTNSFSEKTKIVAFGRKIIINFSFNASNKEYDNFLLDMEYFCEDIRLTAMRSRLDVSASFVNKTMLFGFIELKTYVKLDIRKLKRRLLK